MLIAADIRNIPLKKIAKLSWTIVPLKASVGLPHPDTREKRLTTIPAMLR
jgi:hypothetical protein